MSEWGDEVLRHKYDPLPEDGPRHKKKARKTHVRSDHKHEYEHVIIDAHCRALMHGVWVPYYYKAKRCKVCGRIGSSSMAFNVTEIPDDMRLFEVEDFLEFMLMKELPDELEVKR